ncbi:MAG: four helix bundle protein [Nitrospiraceae bacterium]|nr:four helix bundle protein [Nitrospiraceae bacterium]
MDKDRYIFPFEKLDVWNMAVNLADHVLSILEKLPSNRHLRLISQMEAAVTSVPQNIAEGKGRQHQKEFIQFLSIAQGSLYEMITLSEIFRRRGLFSPGEHKVVVESGEAIDRKLNGLMNSLRGRRRMDVLPQRLEAKK